MMPMLTPWLGLGWPGEPRRVQVPGRGEAQHLAPECAPRHSINLCLDGASANAGQRCQNPTAEGR